MVQVERNILSRVKNRDKKRARGRAGAQDELALLRKIARAARLGGQNRRNSGIQLEIGDDAALWRPRKGYETVLTTDWFLEGRHFLRNVHPPESVGWKCLARAVSDVAAMGGDPRCCLVSLALPSDCTREWLDQYLKGLLRAAREFACPLAGGDTTRFKAILINISVIGEVRTGVGTKRSGAKAGDRIFVSGKLGEAELGLMLLKKGKIGPRPEKALLQKHLCPIP